jgi:NADP-dependent 3-hydroxy acid dehydrogenase YdfG
MIQKQSKGTAVVGGASSGIGAVYADRLAHLRFDLSALDRFLGHTQCNVYALPANLHRWPRCHARGIE